MATKRLKTYKGRAIRLTRLDACGDAVYGPASSIVVWSFVKVTLAEDVEAGTVYRKKNAYGEYCLNAKDTDQVNFVKTTIEFCDVDPDVLDIIGGAQMLTAGADTVGWARTNAVNTNVFAAELWVQGPAVSCAGGAPSWGYVPIPMLKHGKIEGSLEFGNSPLNFSMSAEGYPSTATWGLTPYGDNPLLATAGLPVNTFYAAVETTVQPPAATDGVGALFGPISATQAGDVYANSRFPTITAQDVTNAGRLAALGFIASPLTNWVTGEFFSIGTFKFNWTGSAWAAGIHA